MKQNMAPEVRLRVQMRFVFHGSQQRTTAVFETELVVEDTLVSRFLDNGGVMRWLRMGWAPVSFANSIFYSI